MTKELELFYVAFITVRLYIQSDQFIIVQVTVPTLYHQVPSSFILVLKSLHMNLLKIVTLFTLKVVLGDYHTRITTILTVLNTKLSILILTETIMLFPQLSLEFQNKNLSQIIHQSFYHVSITRLKRMARKGLMEGLPENLPESE